MRFRVSAVLALSVMLLLGCGGDPVTESAGDSPLAEASSGCTERDGAWFGRSADGAFISSQTQEACEERL
ncbi:hypothetical protein RM531_01260 [Salinisphaera sp. P385]|uniref:Secreted protein n=1 Tax=Spectribacter acetivorans TaxID=3075603 RepID=A0ABU3B3Q7_9GAMM|nr:hypothetical protein [Salinisphaera sp. P385]MDT0617094.1 hypothetical protein [Salinisphaera sp. P385]